MNRTEALEAVERLMLEVEQTSSRMQAASGALLEAAAAQQAARQVEKEAEAAIIAANPEGMFTPRKSTEEQREAYLRGVMGDTYRARAMAEEALTMAQHEKAFAEIAAQSAAVRLWAATACLYALTLPEGATLSSTVQPTIPHQTNLCL